VACPLILRRVHHNLLLCASSLPSSRSALARVRKELDDTKSAGQWVQARAYFFCPTTSRKKFLRCRSCRPQRLWFICPFFDRVLSRPVQMLDIQKYKYVSLLAIMAWIKISGGPNPTQQQPLSEFWRAFEGGAFMRKSISCLGAILLIAIVLAGCGRQY